MALSTQTGRLGLRKQTFNALPQRREVCGAAAGRLVGHLALVDPCCGTVPRRASGTRSLIGAASISLRTLDPFPGGRYRRVGSCAGTFASSSTVIVSPSETPTTRPSNAQSARCSSESDDGERIGSRGEPLQPWRGTAERDCQACQHSTGAPDGWHLWCERHRNESRRTTHHLAVTVRPASARRISVPSLLGQSRAATSGLTPPRGDCGAARLPRAKQTRRPWIGRRAIALPNRSLSSVPPPIVIRSRLLLHLFVIDAFLLCVASQVLAFLRHLSEDGRRAQCEKGKQEGNERLLHVYLL